jgi:phage tail-like protein
MVITPPMRGHIEGLPSPRPLSNEVPAALQEDEFCQRLLGALDEVLAPLFLTLDCWDSYLDAQLAPDDFVDWLASWIGVDIDETWSLERRRRLIQDAVGLYRIRGTGLGLQAHIKLYAGITPTIEESGACAWSPTANTPLPGSVDPHLTVRLTIDDPAGINRTTVNRIVGASRPAHLPYELDIAVEGATPRPGARTPQTGGAATGHDGSGVAEDAPGAVDLPGSERIELAPHRPESQEELDEPAESTPPEGKESTD